ncbi:MAG: aldo/keto reductase [Chloroflexota bacterium]
MEYGKIPGIDKPISRIVHGTVMINSREEEKSFALMDAVFEGGCNIFDTAHNYGGGGDNERTVGKWINDRGVRDKVVILGKGAHHNRDRKKVTPFDITADLHDSLARFQTDHIELYILHRDDPEVPVGPIVEILNEHQKAGKIGIFGGSNWSTARLREANEYAAANNLSPFACSSPNFSLADQVKVPWADCISISGAAGQSERDWYLEQNMPLFTWSSIAGGFFSGRFTRENINEVAEPKDTVHCYVSDDNFTRLDRATELATEKGMTVAQIATAYVVNHTLDIYPLIGSWSAEEFQANAAAVDLKLTAEEMAWLELKSDMR